MSSKHAHEKWKHSLLEGAPGLRPTGLTERDSDADTKAWRKRLQKREKQKRHRNNLKDRQKSKTKPKQTIKTSSKDSHQDKNTFYVKNNKAINRRRKQIRAAWREYKSALLSQRAKKAGKEQLRRNPTWNRKQVFSNNKIRREIKKQTQQWYQQNRIDIKRKFKLMRQQQHHLRNKPWAKRQNKKYTYTNANSYDRNKPRIERDTTLKIGTLNVRNINTLTKRQQISKMLEQETMMFF